LHAGDFTFSQATGLNTYEGEQGPFLQHIEARYLLITGLNNYGGACYGLAEIKIEAEEVIISDVEDVAQFDCVEVTVYPNPFADQLTLQFDPVCSGQMQYSLYDISGKIVFHQAAALHSGQSKSIELGRDLPAGTYQLRLVYGGRTIQRSIVKMNRT
jgi:hypothetical protein